MLYNKLAEQQEKLDKLCEDNDLEYSFSRDDFPIIFTFRPMWGKGSTDEAGSRRGRTNHGPRGED